MNDDPLDIVKNLVDSYDKMIEEGTDGYRKMSVIRPHPEQITKAILDAANVFELVVSHDQLRRALWDACWKGTELPERDNCRLCRAPGPNLTPHYGECPGRLLG